MDSWKERSIRRKSEQAMDPRRPLHRGIFKGQRPKGRKARLDELLAARKNFFYWMERIEEAKVLPRVGRRGLTEPYVLSSYVKQIFESARRRYQEVMAACERDRLI